MSYEAQHKKRRWRGLPILLIILFLLILALLCWFLIIPILNPPAATETPTSIPIASDTATETATATATATDTATCVPGTEGCSEPNPQATATETETATATATDTATETPEPPDLVFDPFDPDFQMAWDSSCSNYTVAADFDLVARNQGSSPASAFAVSFAIYNETKQTALSSVSRLNFAEIEAGNAESQSSTITATITKAQIQNSHNHLYLIVRLDVDNQVDEIDESNNSFEIPIEILACGKGAK